MVHSGGNDMAKKQLSAAFVKSAGPGIYGDLHGLRLHVRESKKTKSLSKCWVWRGTIYGVRRDLGLGGWPYVTLKEARDIAFEYRRLAKAGGDPRDLRTQGKVPTFADAVEHVIALHSPGWKDGAKSAAQWRASLTEYAFPRLGKMPVNKITTQDVLAVLTQKTDKGDFWNGKRETARRVKQRISAVMKWAIAQAHRADNPVDATDAALPKNGVHRKSHTSLHWRDVSTALATIEASSAFPTTILAIRFLILTAARSGEVRAMTWDEVDGDVWTVPGARMKTGKPHRVPLSQAAMDVLNEARAYSTGNGLVFPSPRGVALSDNTLSKLLRELEIGCVVHGFRGTFKTWCSETGKSREAAEMALAHAIRGIESHYVKTDLLDMRREIMSEWAEVVTG